MTILSVLTLLMLCGLLYLVVDLQQNLNDLKDHIHALHHDLDTKNKINDGEAL